MILDSYRDFTNLHKLATKVRDFHSDFLYPGQSWEDYLTDSCYDMEFLFEVSTGLEDFTSIDDFDEVAYFAWQISRKDMYLIATICERARSLDAKADFDYALSLISEVAQELI